jgi:hypothetical protein
MLTDLFFGGQFHLCVIQPSATLDALARLRHAAHHLVLVTGRELDDSIRVMPQLYLFSLAVAENGALLYWPDADRAATSGPA